MEPKPIGPYSLFRFAGDIVFVSGQLGIDPQGQKRDIVEQTKNALMNIKNILSSIGIEVSDIVKATIFTTDIDRFSDINAAWAEFFRDSKFLPSRSTVGVSSLPRGALIEIEVFALVRTPISLFYAGRHFFLSEDFSVAHEYFEKAWRKDKKNMYQGLSILSAFCDKLASGIFSDELLKKAFDKILKGKDEGFDFDKVQLSDLKHKVLEIRDKGALDLLKDFVSKIQSVSKIL